MHILKTFSEEVIYHIIAKIFCILICSYLKKLFQKLDQIGNESSTYTIKDSIVNTYIYKDIKNYFLTYINLKFG